MKIKTEPGTVVPLGDGRTSSNAGGTYEVDDALGERLCEQRDGVSAVRTRRRKRKASKTPDTSEEE